MWTIALRIYKKSRFSRGLQLTREACDVENDQSGSIRADRKTRMWQRNEDEWPYPGGNVSGRYSRIVDEEGKGLHSMK